MDNYELDLDALNEAAADLLEKCPGCGGWYDPEIGEKPCCDASDEDHSDDGI